MTFDWVSATLTVQDGRAFSINREGTVMEGPEDFVGRRVLRSTTSNHLFTFPDGEDLGRVVRRVERGASVTTTRVLDPEASKRVRQELQRRRQPWP